jgi:hypothetical protein
MVRKNRVRLDDDEIAQLKMTRQVVYGDDSVPMGRVVAVACEQLIAEQQNDDQGVSF